MDFKNQADYILVSNNIFSGTSNQVFSGFVAVKGNKIVATGSKEDKDVWIGAYTKVYELGDKMITPGYKDNHTFFTGTLLMGKGIDLSSAESREEALQMVVVYAQNIPKNQNIYGYGWNHLKWGTEYPDAESLDRFFPDRPVILFSAQRHKSWMNSAAMEKYKFTPQGSYPEAMALLLKELVQDKEFIKEEFIKFSGKLNSRGVTSIRDISFDDYYTYIAAALKELEEAGRLTLRVSFASQPNLESINFDFAKKSCEQYNSDFINFHGFKIMSDGVVSAYTGDLLESYSDKPETVIKKVDYDRIKSDVLEADRLGYRCCICAEGDAAIRKAVDIFEECREVNGVRDIRHSISDLELTTDEDAERMGKLNIIAEIYPQVMLLNPSYKESYMRDIGGEKREKNFFNYGTMLKAGVVLANGTDLPLQMPSVTDSIYSASGRLFPDGTPEGGWYIERGLPVAEVLKAWTANGAYHGFAENKLGTLEAGKYADIAVVEKNLLEVPFDEIRDTKVVLSVHDGRFVYEA